MAELTGGEAACRALLKLGVKHVFSIPSVHNLPILDAIHRSGEITPVIVRHEQAATHAADGYARASGTLGVVVASTGPGTTNTMTGIYEAAFASSRVMVLTGQAESFYYGKGRGAGHEADRQLHMLQTVARRVESPRYTHDIAPAIFRVAADVQSGRPQPGCVEMPIDIQYGTSDVPVGEPLPLHRARPSSTDLAQAVDLLGSSARRVIIAGGGVNHGGAGEQLVALAEALEAPVYTSVNGRGSIPDDHRLAMGALFDARRVQEAISDAEVILAVGTWFRVRTARPLPGKLIQLDVDPHSIGLNHRTDVNLIGDASLGLSALLDAMNPSPGDAAFLERLTGVRDALKGDLRERIGPDMTRIMDTMRQVMPRDAIFVRDMTQPAYNWGNQLFPIFAPRTTMNPTSGAIGPGLPLANGAALATGRKTVVLHGDGGFMVHIGELATAVQYGLPLVICVFTDGGYGVLRGMQERGFEGRFTGVDLATPNFVTGARGRGMTADSVSGVPMRGYVARPFSQPDQ
ncbi:MAG: thiamine pyrophosphate-binding protein [Gammaproteobacteria bacterium]